MLALADSLWMSSQVSKVWDLKRTQPGGPADLSLICMMVFSLMNFILTVSQVAKLSVDTTGFFLSALHSLPADKLSHPNSSRFLRKGEYKTAYSFSSLSSCMNLFSLQFPRLPHWQIYLGDTEKVAWVHHKTCICFSPFYFLESYCSQISIIQLCQMHWTLHYSS